MKRSKLVNLLQYELHDMDFSSSDTEEVEEFADYLLRMLERNGMLPPTIRYDATNEFVKIKDTDILHDNDISFAWEDEDETE